MYSYGSDFNGGSTGEEEFVSLRLKSLINDIKSFFSGQQNTLLPFDEVARALHARQSVYKGIREVPVDEIIGSVDRYHDFDSHFLPKYDHLGYRWKRVYQAYSRYKELPPVELCKIGQVYFVKDGHHRVSVAKQQGAEFIDAVVTEYPVKVPLTRDVDPRDLLIKKEYEEFLEYCGLDKTRPDQRIEMTVLGRYQSLRDQIEEHKYYLSERAGREIPVKEAAADWYDHVYLPTIRIIEESHILKDFPHRTSADLYVWIMDHKYHLGERYGFDVGIRRATKDFADSYSERMVPGLIKKARKKIRRARQQRELRTGPARSSGQ
ncbi:MAG: hypothetical protein DDT18_01815 [Actinobacteria bacterium]|nr:hypothetical protein [Actinomycetota bacterium]